MLCPRRPTALAAASPSGDECAEEEEDELEPGLEEAEPEPGSAARAAGGSRGAVLTRRGITLRVLLRDGLLEPGCGVLSIYYLGKKFVGDLGADGAITWQETGQVFGSPSAWATHCKRLVNPAKKSGCGWASVRYKGQRLDQYKAAWLRRHQPHVHSEEALPSEGEEDELPEEEEEEVGDGRTPAAEPAVSRRTEERSRKPPGRSAAEQEPPPGKRPESRARAAVRYCTLGTRDAARWGCAASALSPGVGGRGGAGLRVLQEPTDPGGGDVLRSHQQIPALQRGHLQQRPPAAGFPQPSDAQ